MATLVDSGLEYIAKLANGVSTAPFTYVALGSGTTAEANDQTALVTELTSNGLGRAGATCTYEATGKAKWVHEFTSTADTQEINEVGVFDASSSGHMLMRHKYTTAKNLDTDESITVTIVFTEGRAV